MEQDSALLCKVHPFLSELTTGKWWIEHVRQQRGTSGVKGLSVDVLQRGPAMTKEDTLFAFGLFPRKGFSV